jgi:small subunit ribosomal protein S6
MHNYELVVIIHPDLDEEAINQALEKIKDWIVKSGGKIEKIDNWGKRRLAYEIQKQNEGAYFLHYISMPASAVADLEKNLRILEPVMRFLIVAK